jgi:hypothetical protein
MRETRAGTGKPSAGFEEAAVRQQLERIFGSAEFASSRRCQEFLRFVVDKTLAGHADDLKERTIGIELLGRPASYEPSTDATVRVKAGEVRKRLHAYYGGPGAGDELRIDVPAGGYVPEFSAASPMPEIRPATLREAAWARLSWAWILAITAWVLLAGAFVIPRWKAPVDVLDRFWAPALVSGSPVLLCISPVPVFALHPDVEMSKQRPSGPEDFIPLLQNYVGSGDVLALGRLTSMFAEMRHKYRIRLGEEVSFHDLRDTPSVLIGYSYTKWKELNRGLRYLIDTSNRPPVITDNGKPTNWTLPNLKPDRSTDEDYALVTRLWHPDTGKLVVVVAGITQYGSEAASDVVTDSARLGAALQGVPAGWEKKNLEFVLHVRVISGVPGSSTVVAKHVW